MSDARSTDSCPTDAQIESIASGIRVSDQLAAHIARCERCAEKIRLAKFRKRFERVMTDESSSISNQSDSYPDIFGYSILSIIARGGQGIVYHARQDTTGQEVAIKVLDPTDSGMHTQSRERMAREIQIISSLHHPGIVRTLDSIKLSDGRDALVMEYIKGAELNQWRRQNPNCPEESLLELFSTIADSIHHAHQRGIIHRDLKPSNILIDEHGHARILDFGVARWMDILDDESPITRTGEFAGTLSYAAPEQVSAEPSPPDIRTDVYAMGVIAFEIFTGHMLFPSSGSLQSTIQRITAGEIPNRTQSGISHDAWTVLSKAVATEKHRRYQSAADFAADLRRASNGEAIQARGDSRVYLLRKTIRRHRVALSFALVLTIAILGVLVSLAVGNERLSNALHASRMLQIRAHLAAGNREQAEDVLWTEIASGIGPNTDPADAIWRGSAREKELLWCFAEMQSTATCRVVIPKALGPEYGIWPVEDGSFIAVMSDGQLVRAVRDEPGVKFESLFQLPQTAKAIKVTPDGKHLLCFSDGRVWSVSVETSEIIADRSLDGLQLSNTVLSCANWGIGINDREGYLRILTVPDFEQAFVQIGVPSMHTPWLDPYQHVVAYLDNDAVLHAIDLDSNSEISPSGTILFDTNEPWPQPQVLLSPDRTQIVVAYGGGLLMHSAEHGAQPSPILDHPGYRVWVNHDPDWSLLTAIANGDPTLHMWDTTTRIRLSGLPGHTGSVVSHAFTSDGSEVFTIDSEGTLRVWASPIHSWRAKYGQPSARSHQIAIDTKDRLLFTSNNEGDLISYLMDSKVAGQAYSELLQSTDTVRVSLSADRTLIATASMENTICVLSRASGQMHEFEIPVEVDSVTGLRFSPIESSSSLAASVNPARILIFDPGSKSIAHEWEIPTNALVSGIAWSSDGKMLACSLRDGTIALIPDIQNAEVQIINLEATHLRSLSFVQGGSNLVAVGESGVLYVLDTLAGTIRLSERLSEHSLFCVATHPDGQVGVVGDRAGNVKVVDLTTLAELATFDAGGSVMWMEFIDEGNALMISALDCPAEIWDFTDLASTLRLIQPN